MMVLLGCDVRYMELVTMCGDVLLLDMVASF